MVYVSLNGHRNTREVKRSWSRQKERYELLRGMYGNVYEIRDHHRKVEYRQDHPIVDPGDLFDPEALYLHCDYCQQRVQKIRLVRYRLVYDYLTRPQTNPEWKKSVFLVSYACCPGCSPSQYPIPEELKAYHLIELYKDDQLIYSQPRRT
jgi:hypothetical protein